MSKIVSLGLCVLLGLITQTDLAAQLYWDLNGSTAGSGANSTNGTWANNNAAGNRNWTSNSAGTTTTARWNDGNTAVFSAGTDATGSYTVTISGTVVTPSLILEEGDLTISSGSLSLTGSAGIQVAGSSSLTINSTIGGTAGLNKSGSGTLTLGGANTYTGATVVSDGTLQAGTSLNFSGGLELQAGTTLALNGNNVSVGTLTITGNSVIDFGGSSTLNVTTLNITAGATLTIIGWTDAADFFYAANFTGATADSAGTGTASQVVFSGYSGMPTNWFGSDNQLKPVPEPAAYGALFMGLAAGTFLLRRRPRRVTSR